jgi:hypothetical protein
MVFQLDNFRYGKITNHLEGVAGAIPRQNPGRKAMGKKQSCGRNP